MPSEILIPTLFGLVLVVASIGLSYLPNLPSAGRVALRVLTAAGAGYLVYGLSGIIEIGGDRLGFAIRATAGFAVFVLVLLMNVPERLRRRSSPDS